MAMFDNMLMLLDSSADVMSNVTGQAIDFHGEDTKELYYRIVVPKAPMSLEVAIEHSDDGSSWGLLVKSEAITKAGEVILHARSKKAFRRANVTVSGNAGALKIGAVPAGSSRKW